jgi:hypothetical protein
MTWTSLEKTISQEGYAKSENGYDAARKEGQKDR